MKFFFSLILYIILYKKKSKVIYFDNKRIKPNPYDPNTQGFTYDTIISIIIVKDK